MLVEEEDNLQVAMVEFLIMVVMMVLMMMMIILLTTILVEEEDNLQVAMVRGEINKEVHKESPPSHSGKDNPYL